MQVFCAVPAFAGRNFGVMWISNSCDLRKTEHKSEDSSQLANRGDFDCRQLTSNQRKCDFGACTKSPLF